MPLWKDQTWPPNQDKLASGKQGAVQWVSGSTYKLWISSKMNLDWIEQTYIKGTTGQPSLYFSLRVGPFQPNITDLL
jgi:hypothetical protein